MNGSTEALPHMQLSTEHIIQLAIKGVLFVSGISINVRGLVEVRAVSQTTYSLLKCQLCISDMLLITTYSSYCVMWIVAGSITHYYSKPISEMKGVCKTMQFTLSLVFYLASFMTVTIAVERVTAVYRPLKMLSSRRSQLRRTAKVILLSWITAVVFSLPQLYIWLPGPTKAECVTVWWVPAEQYCLKQLVEALALANNTVSDIPMEIIELDTCIAAQLYEPESAYRIVHLCVTFWLPILIIFVCNLLLYFKLKSQTCDQQPACAGTSRMRHQLRRAELKHMAILTAFFCISWLPNNVCELLNVVRKDLTNAVLPYTMDIVMIWAVLNPLVYRNPREG